MRVRGVGPERDCAVSSDAIVVQVQALQRRESSDVGTERGGAVRTCLDLRKIEGHQTQHVAHVFRPQRAGRHMPQLQPSQV